MKETLQRLSIAQPPITRFFVRNFNIAHAYLFSPLNVFCVSICFHVLFHAMFRDIAGFLITEECVS